MLKNYTYARNITKKIKVCYNKVKNVYLINLLYL